MSLEINEITQNISPVTALPGLLEPERPAAVNVLVEQELPLLSTEVETLVGQLNDFKDEANALGAEVEINKNLAEASATLANGLTNFKGAWSGATTYAKGESVESTAGSKIYYTSKLDGNLNNIVTNTTYWLLNPINDKLDKDTAVLTAKTSLADTDIVLIGDSAASNTAKKITWANLKTSIGTALGAIINSLTAKTTPVDADGFVINDSESSNASKFLSWVNLKATLKTYFDIYYLNFVANDSRVKTALNASGTAPIYACRAWVNFNGTGTVAIGASGNVSSITDNGIGDYTVNFTTAMQDANYSSVGLGGVDNHAHLYIKNVPTTTSLNITVGVSNAISPTDITFANIAIFR